MTNAQIIFNNQMELLRDGKLKTTGRFFTYEDSEGNKKTIEEPEQIHTYARWKAMGYQVQKGKKAVSQFMIWKHATKKPKDGEEDLEERMFLKKASFFSRSQVEKIEKA